MIIQNCTDFISKCNKVYFDYQNPCVRYNKIYLAFFKNITCYVFKYSSKKSRPLSLLLVSNCYHFHCRKRSPSAPQWRAVQTHQRAWEKARHLPEPCLYEIPSSVALKTAANDCAFSSGVGNELLDRPAVEPCELSKLRAAYHIIPAVRNKFCNVHIHIPPGIENEQAGDVSDTDHTEYYCQFSERHAGSCKVVLTVFIVSDKYSHISFAGIGAIPTPGAGSSSVM